MLQTLHKLGAEAGDDVVMVNPSEVVELMKRAPYGRVTTLAELGRRIAKDQ